MSLFLVGGGYAPELGAAYDRFVAEAQQVHTKTRGQRCRIAIVMAPGGKPEWLTDYRSLVCERWPEVQTEAIVLGETLIETAGTDTTTEDAPTCAEDVSTTSRDDPFATCAGIIVCGGFVPDYLDHLSTYRVQISQAVASGVPYLGFSAGAHVVSKHALCGGWKDGTGHQVCPEAASDGLEEITIRDGLGLIGTTIETHTDAWSNLGVAMAVLDHDEIASSVAIDEATCLVVDHVTGRNYVLGEGRTHWFSQVDGVWIVRREDGSTTKPFTRARRRRH